MTDKTVHPLPRMAGAHLPLERVRDANFAKRLKTLMDMREMTQSKVAAEIWGRVENKKGAMVAKGRDRLSVWTSGKNFPDPENLQKLARALKVEVSELAPEAELRAATHGAADWSFTKPADGSDRVFVQIAKFVSPRIAHEIQGLLLKDQEQQGKTNDREGRTP
jgi:transcriptional regulator with XRE-family HTH domain